MRGIEGDDLADDEPVGQHADRGQVLLDGRLLMRRADRFQIRADVERLDLDEIGDAPGVAPGEEVRARGM